MVGKAFHGVVGTACPAVASQLDLQGVGKAFRLVEGKEVLRLDLLERTVAFRDQL